MKGKIAVVLVAALVALAVSKNEYFRLFSSGNERGIFEIVNALRTPANVEDNVKSYDSKQGGAREQPMVNAFYNLATDFYEYGWGKSFHFAHTMADEGHDESIIRHERRLADILGLKPGQTAVDCGCGVGGPAREIARYSGANVIGVTLNEYQVAKANEHSKNENITHLVNVVQGDFTKMAFKDEELDAAYAIEATCHSPTLEAVYGEVFRVLKPGSVFATYEWLTTANFDKNNKEHVDVMRQLEYGNGLPPTRTLEQALQAGKTVGFELIKEEDLAKDKEGTRPWYHRLDMSYWSIRFTHYSCTVMELLGLAPVGTVQTHAVLIDAAVSLVASGKSEIFTPMHLIVFKKPEKKPEAK